MNFFLRHLASAAIAASAVFTATAWSGGDGEADRGAILALSCAACHGPEGRSAGAIPSLWGRDAAFIAESLREFRAGTREATVMNRIAKGYSDEEILALAAYFGGIGGGK